MSYKGDYDILREFINESLDTNEVRIDEKITTSVKNTAADVELSKKSDWTKSFGGTRDWTGLPTSVRKLGPSKDYAGNWQKGSIGKFGKSVTTLGGAVGDKVKAGHKKLVSGSSRYKIGAEYVSGAVDSYVHKPKSRAIEMHRASVNKMTPKVREFWHKLAGEPDPAPPPLLPRPSITMPPMGPSLPGCPPSPSQVAAHFATLNSADRKFLRSLSRDDLTAYIDDEFGCD